MSDEQTNTTPDREAIADEVEQVIARVVTVFEAMSDTVSAAKRELENLAMIFCERVSEALQPDCEYTEAELDQLLETDDGREAIEELRHGLKLSAVKRLIEAGRVNVVQAGPVPIVYSADAKPKQSGWYRWREDENSPPTIAEVEVHDCGLVNVRITTHWIDWLCPEEFGGLWGGKVVME